jgi:hypothetical protein
MTILVGSSLDSGAPTICGSLTQQKRALPHLPAPPAACLQLALCTAAEGRRREWPAAPGRAGRSPCRPTGLSARWCRAAAVPVVATVAGLGVADPYRASTALRGLTSSSLVVRSLGASIRLVRDTDPVWRPME